MSANSKIEWTHHTFNAWRGCTKVSAGCAHCYAERQSLRNPKVLGIWGDDGQRVIAAESYWKQPLAWDKAAAAAGERHRVFCASMADVFEDRPELVDPRYRLFDLINRTPDLDWLLLTKRPENAKRLWPLDWLMKPAENVWLGVSVEDQKTADERIPKLLEISAAVRFLSVEPLLDQIDFMNADGDRLRGGMTGEIHWIIVGGESGPHARPMHPGHARKIRDDCEFAKIPFFFKQWGEFVPYEHDAQPPFLSSQRGDFIDGHALPATLTETCNELVDGWWLDETLQIYRRVGKHAAGRLLDGREWNEFPEVAHAHA